VKALLSQNFGGSAAGLMVNLLEATSVEKEELDELEAYIREYRRKSGVGERSRE
jgi:predicted transcriptional regulator